MKILLLSWNFAPVVGGLEGLVTQLFRALQAIGHQPRVVTAHASSAAPEDEVDRAGAPGIAAYLKHAFRRGFTLCRSWKPEVILCGSVVTAPVAWVLSRRFRIPFVVVVHGSDLIYQNWIYQRGIRFALARADHVIANSGPTLQLAIAAGLRGSKLSVVNPGVELQRFEGAGFETPLPPAERKLILSVGRLVRRKGIVEFIEHVMPQLVEADPTVLYVVVGGDATASLAHRERLSETIAAKIEVMGLSGHVELRGEASDCELVEWYRRADLFVLPVLDVPGDVEGFGIVFLEAALGHTASVSTRVGGIPEAVEDGTSGILVEPGDHEAMARTLTQLLSDGERREQLAQRGEERARNEFAWPAVAARYMRVLQSVVGSESSS
jgi:phosphatidylinositol alpha-1,6-mannosyltransferase